MVLYITLFLMISFYIIVENGIYGKKLNRKQSNYIGICIALLLVVVSGTRNVGGTDYFWYKRVYETTPSIRELLTSNIGETSFYLRSMDMGYLMINSLCKGFGISWSGFTFIHASFFYFAMYKGLKRYCDNFSIVLMVFLAKVFFYNTFISMRQSITVAVFFLALPLIENRKLIKYMVICVLCALIHAGAIIMIPFYFVPLIKLNGKRVLFASAIMSAFPILNIPIFNFVINIVMRWFSFFSPVWAEKANNYLSSGDSGISKLYLIEYMLVAIIISLFYTEIKNQFKHGEFVVGMFIMLLPLFTIFSSISIVTRMKDYFILSYGVLLANVLEIKKIRYRAVIMLTVIFICGFEFFRFILLFDGGDMLRYQSYLFAKIDG